MKQPPLIIHSIGHFFYKKNLKPIAKIFEILNRVIFSLQLPSKVKIGKGVILGYQGLGIVIHADSDIPDNCWIAHNVTVGTNLGNSNSPKLGKNNFLAPGSKVLGDITLGDNVIVGANSVVLESIKKDTVVAGSPAKHIAKINEPPENFYHNRHEFHNWS